LFVVGDRSDLSAALHRDHPRHDRRRIIHFNVTQNPSQIWLAHQMTRPSVDTAPRYLLRAVTHAYVRSSAIALQAMESRRCHGSALAWHNAYVERILARWPRVLDQSYLRCVTCAVCCRPTFSITTKRDPSRFDKIVRRAARYNPLRAGEAHRFRGRRSASSLRASRA